MVFDFFPLMIGLFGGLHCLGMCGPLVLAYSLQMQGPSHSSSPSSKSLHWQSSLLHHLAFHVGRLTIYGVLGALGAGLFRAADLGRIFFNIRNGMTLAGGALLFLIGLFLLKLLPLPSFLVTASTLPGTLLGRVIPPLFRSHHAGSKIALGMCTGLLPCCLSWAMIVTASATADPVAGFLTMVLFGLGTVPTLFSVGLSASLIPMRMRFLGERLAGLSVLCLAIVLILRGMGFIS